MLDDVSVFLTTRTNSTHWCEIAGDVLLTPVRIVWNGWTVQVAPFQMCQELTMTIGKQANHRQREAIGPLGKLAFIIVSIVTIVPGILFKGLAYLSADVRERHHAIKEWLKPYSNPQSGVSIAFPHPEDNIVDFTIDLQNYDEKKDISEAHFIGQKLASLKPHAYFQRSPSSKPIALKYKQLKLEHTTVGTEEKSLDLSAMIQIGAAKCSLEGLLHLHGIKPLCNWVSNSGGRPFDPGYVRNLCMVDQNDHTKWF